MSRQRALVLLAATAIVAVLAVCVLPTLSEAAAGEPLPLLPLQFSISVQTNDLQLQSSTDLDETLDLIYMRAYYERRSATQNFAGVYNYTAHAGYVWDPRGHDQCTLVTTPPFGFDPAHANYNTVSPGDILGYPSSDEVWTSVGEARGIPCDIWVGKFERTTNGVREEGTISYLYALPTWVFVGLPGARVPIEAHIVGTRYEPVGGGTTPIDIVFSFTNFVPGPQPDTLFQISDTCYPNCANLCNGHGRCNLGTCECDSGYSGVSCQESSNRLALALGLGLGLGLTAIIVTAVLCVCMRKRELNKYKSLGNTDTEMSQASPSSSEPVRI